MGVYVCHMSAWYPQTPEEGIGPPQSEVTDICELPWELKMGPLEEYLVLFTESSLQIPEKVSRPCP